MVKSEQINTTFNQWDNPENINILRALSLFVFFAILMGLNLFQKPFVQSDLLLAIYSVGVLFFINHLMMFFQNKTYGLSNVNIFIDTFIYFIIFIKAPSLYLFGLVFLLIHLFLSSLLLTKIQILSLLTVTSLFFSFINAKFLLYQGAHNVLTLAMFNLSIIAVSFVGYSFKSTYTELTEKVETVEKKYQSQAEFANTLMQQIPFGVVARDYQDHVLFQNQSLTDKMKIDSSSLKEILSQLIHNVSEITYFNKHENEKKILKINKGEYLDQTLEQNVNLYLIEDVTNLKHLEEQLRQKDKLAAIGQLAAGIAHEIRNPLAGISGSIQLLSADTQDEQNLKLFKIISKEIDRLNNLITEFLDYSKPEKRPEFRVDLGLLMNEVIVNIKNQNLAKPVEIISDIQSVSILGYADKLKQAFLNIVMNGIQAMNEIEKPKIEIKVRASNENAVVSVRDFGSGMTEDIKKKIFEPFFTTKAKGTGLGMAVTHKILESHEAQIQINSEVGKGTEFVLIFKVN